MDVGEQDGLRRDTTEQSVGGGEDPGGVAGPAGVDEHPRRVRADGVRGRLCAAPRAEAEHPGRNLKVLDDAEHRVPVGDSSQFIERRLGKAEVIRRCLVRDVLAAVPACRRQVRREQRGALAIGYLCQPDLAATAPTQHGMAVGGANVADPLGLGASATRKRPP